ncbi:enoyl-CoA hydratase domain-containing protein 3, mitochondrial [Scaptodrosophila lebanonensis]|uniref:Enoyl-CoA hydratase domain-containing protein 3, mitochondrial n=1 Tax=Drosophila lebanonensis TaxID=7225 RepID=A0A6J2UIF9_DROLE|nr:enoyl-CoA hydratase domain-containing protein 3, mitochondrial [Scaptodrosophila lebanonensis]
MLRSLQTCLKIHSRYGAYRLASNATEEQQQFVSVSEISGVREIMLNHPKTLNSLSMDMMTALQDAMIKDVDDINLRCIVLSAKGKMWSAGHNLKELQGNQEIQERVFQKLTDIISTIQKIPVPVIAKVNGYAAAAGCQLVASCDMLVCSDKSMFSTPGASVGVFCSTPGIAISRIMPRPKAAYMLLTGLPIGGEEAYIAGLATKVVPEAELDDEIDRITCAIKSKSRAVISFGKKFFYQQLGMPLNKAYEQGKTKMCDNLKLADSQEGIQSFIEKRPPKWNHEN